jgi:hypothetical protein
MKKVVFSFLVCAFALMSCSKDDSFTTSPEQISVSSTPASIVSYVGQNYPDATISTVFKYSNSDTVYTVTLNTYELIAFDGRNGFIGEAMSDTLCDPRPDNDSIPGGHHGDRRHGGGRHGGGHHGGGPGGLGIPYDSIPVAVISYVTANYPGYTVHHANLATLCQFGSVMEVMIDSAFQEHRKLIFDVTGVFLAKASRVNTADLPAAVTTAYTAAYPAYKACEKSETFVLADGSVQYKVFLNLDKVRTTVVYKEDGTLVCKQ